MLNNLLLIHESFSFNFFFLLQFDIQQLFSKMVGTIIHKKNKLWPFSSCRDKINQVTLFKKTKNCQLEAHFQGAFLIDLNKR